MADDTAQMTKDLNKVARDTNTLNGQVNDLLAVLLQQKLQGTTMALMRCNAPSRASLSTPKMSTKPLLSASVMVMVVPVVFWISWIIP